MTNFRLSFFFLLLLLALSSYGDEVLTAGFKPAVKTSSRIAFLVGINSYKATTSLKYAVGDSEAIEDLLLRTGKYDKLIKLNDNGKITTVLNPETLSYSSQRVKMAPTKANIEATYQEVLAENPETLIFYYSGHGFIEGEGGENFIAPKDVDVKFEKRKVGKEEKHVPVPLNGISLKTMGIQAAKVKRVVFLIDACRSPLPEAEGESGEKGEKALSASKKEETNNEKDFTSKEIKLKQNLLSTRTDKLPKRVLEAEGITMLIGAAPEVSSLEDEDLKSGIFTHFLKKAFNGGVQEENQEEYITEENLSRYIEDRFKNYYELRKKETGTAAEPKLYNLTFDRGKKGEILISQHRPIEGKERIDKPIYTDTIRKREVKGKLVYNEKGEREDLRFFVHDKKRDVYYPDSLDGVYKMEYAFQKDKAGELENFSATEFNLENEEVFEYGTKLIPDVGWEYRGLYNSTVANNIVGAGFKPAPTVDKEKIRFEKIFYDFNGNIISEEYFDGNGKLIEFGKVSKIVRAFDKYGQMKLEEFYAKDTLDEYGDIIEKGKLVAKDDFARYKAKYKSKGYLLLETWEDEEGKAVNIKSGKNSNGYAKVKYIYDKSDKLIRKKVYDNENKAAINEWGVSVYSYSYNSDCIKYYETKLPRNLNQVLISDRKLEIYKHCLTEEIHTDKEGKPANDENQIYKKIRQFNQKGFLVSEESFSADGRRFLENAVAKVEYTHDADGKIISQKNFGEFEVNGKLVPISDANGVHEYRYSYFDYYEDGTPLFNSCIYQRQVNGILIKPFDCALKIERFGMNGKQIKEKNDAYTTYIYYTGVEQVEFERMNYSSENKFLFRKNKHFSEKRVFMYNGVRSDGFLLEAFDVKGKERTLGATFKVIDGREFLNMKKEIRYDERNNKIFETTHEANDGVIGADAILKNKEVFKYDERNNITLSFRTWDRFGYPYWYESAKNEYDARNNKTLEVVSTGQTQISKYKNEFKYDESNNKILEINYNIIDGKEVLISKKEWKYDKRKNKILETKYNLKDGKEILVKKDEWKYKEKNIGSANSKVADLLLERKSYFVYEREDKREVFEEYRNEYKYDEKNNESLEAEYEVKDGKEVLVRRREKKYDERNNNTLDALYEIQEGKEVLDYKSEYKYDDRNNETLSVKYETIEGKEVLVRRTEKKYDDRNNNTLDALYEIQEGKEVIVWKTEFRYDERNNRTLKLGYRTKEGKEVLVWRKENKYDEKNNEILEAEYKVKEGKEILLEKKEKKYDETNKKTLEANYETKDGKEVLVEKTEYKYDLKNNVILRATYKMENGIEFLIKKSESQYDEKNKETFSSKFSWYDEKSKNTLSSGSAPDIQAFFNFLDNIGFRIEYYYGSVNRKYPESRKLEEQLEKIKDSKDPKDESEKKALIEKLEPSKKYFETNEKRFTLTKENYGPNEKLESASYKLLFFNPRGPVEKRLMRVDLDRFYRPVKVGFEEE